jgi:hypothetical protein
MKIHPFAVPIEQEKPHLHQYDHERRRPLAQYASFSWSPFRCPAIIRCPTVPANYGSQLAHEEIHCGAARCFGHYGRRPFWTSGGASRCVRSAGFGWRRSRTAIRGTIWGFVRVPLYSSPGSFGIRPEGPASPAALLPHDPLEQGEGLRLVRLRREQVRRGLHPGDNQLEPGENIAMRVQVAPCGEPRGVVEEPPEVAIARVLGGTAGSTRRPTPRARPAGPASGPCSSSARPAARSRGGSSQRPHTSRRGPSRRAATESRPFRRVGTGGLRRTPSAHPSR